MPAVRLMHYSDVHLTAKPLGWRPRDLVSKRVTGWANVKLLGRGKTFRLAPRVVAALDRDIRARRPDAVVFSGDATGMGFESEVAVAAAALGVGDESLPPAVAVAGNHDYYTHRSQTAGYFERLFAPWQQGERVDGHVYPFARRVGDVWLVCVNSCTANRWNWDASGAVGADQLGRLGELCKGLGPAPRVLVTHYPLRTSRGTVERRAHRLRDHAALLAAAVECRIGLWLHGHLHRPFYLAADGPGRPFPVICAGSATQQGHWGYNEYSIDGGTIRAVRRGYDPTADGFADGEPFALEMPT